VISSLSEHQLLVFWTQLLVLLVAARLLGALARRVGQPAVIGELLAGVLLGPSVFGELWPAGFAWFLPDDPEQSAMLVTVGWLGVVLLLLATGFETDLALISSLGRAAVLVATGSLAVPLALGFGVGWLVPADFVGTDTTRLVFALFLATALSISSLPVIAKILGELGLLRRNFGQLTLAAGMANDVVGWILLGVIAGIATSGSASLGGVAFTLVGMGAFFVAAFTVGQRLVDAALRRARRRGDTVGEVVGVVVIITLAFAVITQALHVEAVLGAFVAGIVLGRSRFHEQQVVAHIESITGALLAPVFFATAGLRVDLAALADAEVVVWAVVIIAVASISKVLGSFLGARAAGLGAREGLALGAGLNARGALEIVIATIGLSIGVLESSAYTVVVLMAIATTVMAPPMLRSVVRGWEGDDAERARLAREESMRRNVLVRPTRLLVPSRGSGNSIAAAQVLHFAWPAEAAATVLSVGEGMSDEPLDPVLAVLHGRQVEVRHVGDGDPVARILDEAALGFGVIGLGASDASADGAVLSPLVDRLLVESPVPLVIVRRARGLEGRLPSAFARALVPVTGSRASLAAQEVAGSLSAELGTEVVFTHIDVVRGERDPGRVFWRHPAAVAPSSVAAALVRGATALAAERGARARIVERSGANPAAEIVQLAREEEVDLVVLGATARRVDDRPFLGHTVAAILAEAETTVAVVVVPPVPAS